MTRFVFSRLLWAAPNVIAILVICFLTIHVLPGDPVHVLVGDFPAPSEYIDQVRREFGLDKPLLTQLCLYISNLAHGNLGYSFANRQPVLSLLLARSQITLLLMLPALSVAALAGILCAVAAAPRAGSLYDGVITALSLFGYSVPIFWLGQILILVFAVDLRWLPAQGMISLRTPPKGIGVVWDVLWHLVLPAFSITIYFMAVVARVARASVLETLGNDFVLTARSKGLSARQVMWGHVLPNALIPVITVIGYSFGSSLTGAILVETVFGWPGLGNLLITSITNRDYPVLQGIFLFTALLVVVVNLITDFLYGAIDPRTRTAVRQSE
jgi:ABC-type dipeptide/oligopeptide/nickel transport system permease component